MTPEAQYQLATLAEHVKAQTALLTEIRDLLKMVIDPTGTEGTTNGKPRIRTKATTL